mmetsp:Transcript_19442/g.41873  ORF Transcript_19442/g.41873 Transcript_19442/m.41873 type:complete len:286 (+) Transcript_19442:834-1691(+)
MSEDTAVGAHAWYNIKCVELRQFLNLFVQGVRFFSIRLVVVALVGIPIHTLIGQSQQSRQQSFGKMFGHGFSRMLSVNDPTRQGSGTRGDAFDFPSLQRLTQRRNDDGTGTGGIRRCTLRHQAQMTRVGIGRKVAKVNAGRCCCCCCAMMMFVREFPRQFALGIKGISDATPTVRVFHVGAVTDGTARPGFGVRHLVGILQNVLQFHRAAFIMIRQSADGRSKGKVLHVTNLFQFRVKIGLDLQNDVNDSRVVGVGLLLDEFDVAAIKGIGNANGKGHGDDDDDS